MQTTTEIMWKLHKIWAPSLAEKVHNRWVILAKISWDTTVLFVFSLLFLTLINIPILCSFHNDDKIIVNYVTKYLWLHASKDPLAMQFIPKLN